MLGTLRFTPKTISGKTAHTFPGQAGAVDTTGVLVKVASGAALKPVQVAHSATMIWMSDKYVLGTQNVAACHGSCPTLKAPGEATEALLIRAEPVEEIATDTPVTKG